MLGDLPKLKKVYRLDPLQAEASDRDRPTRFGSLTRAKNSTLPHSTNPDRLVYLAYTSGTTGQPKGVMHSDNTILANSRAMVKDWRFDQNTVVYSFSPLSHNIGIVGLAVGIAAGGEFVVHTPLDAPRMFDRVVETNATFLLGVPTHALDLLAEVRRRSMKTLGSVKAFEIGGSAVPPALVRDLFEIGVTTQNAFGMTENHSFLYTGRTIRPMSSRQAAASRLKAWRSSSGARTVRTRRCRRRGRRARRSRRVADARLFRRSGRDRECRSTATAGS